MVLSLDEGVSRRRPTQELRTSRGEEAVSRMSWIESLIKNQDLYRQPFVTFHKGYSNAV